MSSTNFALAILATLALQAFSVSALAEDGGNIAGHITRSRTSEPVANMPVEIRESGKKSTTNAEGAYSFTNLAPGTYTVVVTSSSGQSIEHKVTVVAAKTTGTDISIGAEMSALQSIVVLAQRTPISIAREAQFEAPNLINIETYQQIRQLPDISTAEAVRRIPGISLETDEGEGRYVNIRGLDADLNSTTFGGLRLPPTNNASPFGGYRAVTLDSIPVGLIGAITVTKSNLPSQDAEALGGTIEITPKTAPQGGAPFIQGNVGSGYEPLRGTGIVDIGVTAGGRFGGSGNYAQQPFSVVLTATDYDDKRGIDDVEPAYFNDGVLPYQAINNIQQRDYELHRKRHGYGIDLGFQPDSDNSYYIRAFDAGYTEYYLRQFLNLTPDGNTVQTESTFTDTLNTPGAIQNALRDEKETSRDLVTVIGGQNVFSGKILDYRIGYTQGTYSKPYDYNSAFNYVNPGAGTPNSTIIYSLSGLGHTPIYQILGAPGFLDPANYQFSSFANSSAYNFDKELSFAGNLELPLNWGGFDKEDMKFGASARLRKKRLTAQPYSYPNVPPAIPLLLSNASSGGNETYYSGQYQQGVDIRPGYLQSVFGYGTIAPGDQIGALQQFLDAKEDVYALYGQYEMSKGPVGLVGGLRVERTTDRSNAFLTGVDAAGNTIVSPVTATNAYTNFFPSIQLRYEIQPKLITRATWSSTIARPGFNQSNVSKTVDFGSGQVVDGNPGLKPATANSFDLTVEQYLPGSGILSFGIFDKQIKDYIVANNIGFEIINGLPLRRFSYSNASGSFARGAEFNYEQRFPALPGLLSGLGIALNYTFVDSRFEIRPGEFSQLPSTSKNTWNATLFYEHAGLVLRLAAYSTSQDLFAIGGDRTGDVYNATRTSMDFGSSYGFMEHWAVYFNAKNLLNTPHAFYQGTSDRPIQREFYGQTYQLGVRFDY